MKGLSCLLCCTVLFSYLAFNEAALAAGGARVGGAPDRVAAITENAVPAPENPEPTLEAGNQDIVVQSSNHFEVIGGYGRSRLDASNSELRVTLSETDKLVQTNSNSWNTQTGQLGLGYLYYYKTDPNPKRVQWFKYIEPQFNLYQLSSNSIEGDVWRFNNPNLNQLTYDMPIHSTQLMLDVALAVATFKKLSVYAKGGVGEAWTSVGYSDTCNNGVPGCSGTRISLKTNLNPAFAWEAGAGLILAFTDSVGLSFEYLYKDLGNVRTSGSGTTGTVVNPKILPAKFSLSAQTMLLGIHLAM